MFRRPEDSYQRSTELDQLQAQYNIRRVGVYAGIGIYHQIGSTGRRSRTLFTASGRLVSALHHSSFLDSDFIKAHTLDILLSRTSSLPDNGVKMVYGSRWPSLDNGVIIITDEEGTCYQEVAVTIRTTDYFRSQLSLVDILEFDSLISGTSGSPIVRSDGRVIGVYQGTFDARRNAFGVVFNSQHVVNELKRATGIMLT